MVYATGTTTLASLFTSSAKTTAASNPVTADPLGNFTFYAGPGIYDLANSGTTVTVASGVTPTPALPVAKDTTMLVRYLASDCVQWVPAP